MESRPDPKTGERYAERQSQNLHAALKSATGEGIRFRLVSAFSQRDDGDDLEVAGAPARDEDTGKNQYVIRVTPSFALRDGLRENQGTFNIADPLTGETIKSFSVGGRCNHIRLAVDELPADTELL